MAFFALAKGSLSIMILVFDSRSSEQNGESHTLLDSVLFVGTVPVSYPHRRNCFLAVGALDHRAEVKACVVIEV